MKGVRLLHLRPAPPHLNFHLSNNDMLAVECVVFASKSNDCPPKCRLRKWLMQNNKSSSPGLLVSLPHADFWQYTSSYREQPSVHFLRELIVQVGGEGGGGRVWSSFPNLNLLLQQGELATPTIRVGRD